MKKLTIATILFGLSFLSYVNAGAGTTLLKLGVKSSGNSDMRGLTILATIIIVIVVIVKYLPGIIDHKKEIKKSDRNHNITKKLTIGGNIELELEPYAIDGEMDIDEKQENGWKIYKGTLTTGRVTTQKDKCMFIKKKINGKYKNAFVYEIIGEDGPQLFNWSAILNLGLKTMLPNGSQVGFWFADICHSYGNDTFGFMRFLGKHNLSKQIYYIPNKTNDFHSGQADDPFRSMRLSDGRVFNFNKKYTQDFGFPIYFTKNS